MHSIGARRSPFFPSCNGKLFFFNSSITTIFFLMCVWNEKKMMIQFFLWFRLYNLIFSIGKDCIADASIFRFLTWPVAWRYLFFSLFFSVCACVSCRSKLVIAPSTIFIGTYLEFNVLLGGIGKQKYQMDSLLWKRWQYSQRIKINGKNRKQTDQDTT